MLDDINSVRLGSDDEVQGPFGFEGRVIGITGAYREGNIVRISTSELGIIEVRVPGNSVPEIDSQIVLTLRKDAFGTIAS